MKKSFSDIISINHSTVVKNNSAFSFFLLSSYVKPIAFFMYFNIFTIRKFYDYDKKGMPQKVPKKKPSICMVEISSEYNWWPKWHSKCLFWHPKYPNPCLKFGLFYEVVVARSHRSKPGSLVKNQIRKSPDFGWIRICGVWYSDRNCMPMILHLLTSNSNRSCCERHYLSNSLCLICLLKNKPIHRASPPPHKHKFHHFS